jgi:DNA-directed RNA polymerase subunit RPC12/RpoP
METITKTFYKCSTCKQQYGTEKEALDCESKAVSQDKGIKVGDKIKITSGEGAGQTATVKSVFVFDKYWGHYAWERYWHTVGLTADLDSWGSRQLTFDAYEPL